MKKIQLFFATLSSTAVVLPLVSFTSCSSNSIFKVEGTTLLGLKDGITVDELKEKVGDTLVIPSNITRIENKAFVDKNGESTLVWNKDENEGVKHLDLTKAKKLIYIGESAFRRAPFEELNIPDSVSIDNHAFEYCIKAKSLTFFESENQTNDSIAIEPMAFYNCQYIEKLTLTERMYCTDIGNGAFACFFRLKEIDMSKINRPLEWSQPVFNWDPCIKLPDPVVFTVKFCDEVFDFQGALDFLKNDMGIDLPPSRQPITFKPDFEKKIFKYQSSDNFAKITSLNISKEEYEERSGGKIAFPTQTTEIADSAFYDNASQSSTFPSTIRRVNWGNISTIGQKAFYDAAFRDVVLSSKMTTIGTEAFGFSSPEKSKLKVVNMVGLDPNAGFPTGWSDKIFGGAPLVGVEILMKKDFYEKWYEGSTSGTLYTKLKAYLPAGVTIYDNMNNLPPPPPQPAPPVFNYWLITVVD